MSRGETFELRAFPLVAIPIKTMVVLVTSETFAIRRPIAARVDTVMHPRKSGPSL